MEDRLEEVRIEVLGRFRVVIGAREIGAAAWPSRRARELVALLALADGYGMARDCVIEHLWPHLDAGAGAANLRKAAHHARRTLGDREAVVLRAGRVELFPGRAIGVDATRFLGAAERALGDGDRGACARVADGCAGELLPDSPYEAWAQEPRRLVHARLCELLRRGGQWERLAEIEPADEAACRELMQAEIGAGRRHAAIRCYERLRVALARELGTRPVAETCALYEQCIAGARPGEPVFVGREPELAQAAAHLRFVARAGTAALLIRGPTGIGKSAFCREVAARADADCWRVISVTATSSERPYGPLGAIIEQLVVQGGGAFEALPARTRSILAGLTDRAAGARARGSIDAPSGRRRGAARAGGDRARVAHDAVRRGRAPPRRGDCRRATGRSRS